MTVFSTQSYQFTETLRGATIQAGASATYTSFDRDNQNWTCGVMLYNRSLR